LTKCNKISLSLHVINRSSNITTGYNENSLLWDSVPYVSHLKLLDGPQCKKYTKQLFILQEVFTYIAGIKQQTPAKNVLWA
jgi:hypothetical protein